MAIRLVYSPEFPEGQRVTLTAEEEAVREALRIESNKKIAAREAAAAAKIEADAQLATDKASARVKLKAAEYTPLTEAEADAITG
tara:strand:- start:58 stop:312 length:255 start_codon:yes stop_codon:yes gene_type:complete